jgi:hypothetical protein
MANVCDLPKVAGEFIRVLPESKSSYAQQSPDAGSHPAAGPESNDRLQLPQLQMQWIAMRYAYRRPSRVTRDAAPGAFKP